MSLAGSEAGGDADGETSRRPRAAFYCVSSREYFLGAVGLVNSLRLVGHAEPIYLLDAGLEPAQRELLAAEVTPVDPPAGPEAVPPHLQKTIAPLRHPAEVMVLIDADMIATRSLAGLIEEASAGRVVAPRMEVDRFVAEWGELGLGEAHRHPYVTSGLMLLGGSVGERTVRLMDELGRRIDVDRTFLGATDSGYAFHYADQDVLNAILSTARDSHGLLTLDPRLVAGTPFAGLEVLDAGSLRCAYSDGMVPLVIHHALSAKPWLEPAWEGVYSRFLRRVLVGSDVAVAVPAGMVPLRLRDGALAELERRRVNVKLRLRWHLAQPVLSRIRAARAWVSGRVGRR